jgi:hypothetical protein
MNDNLTTNASNEAESPAFLVGAVMRSSLSKSEYMKKVVRYYNGSDDWRYKAIDAYKLVDNAQKWELCPKCGLFPKIWEFNNGSCTACGCGDNQYTHPSIHAESIMSYVKRSHNGTSALGYDNDALRKNWNHWCKTGEEIFVHAGKRTDGRW